MQKSKNKHRFSGKLLRILSTVFLVASIGIFILVGISVGYQDLQEIYSLADETISYLETECKKFDNYTQGSSARALQDLLDTAIGLRTFIDPSSMEDSEFLL